MENPSRTEPFPVGLRVLVVDDDPTWLKILEKMLRKCSYDVTTCGLATVALSLLRERREKFDIVISDVNMPDMDGFKLLEQVGLEMDLPVIMMSVDGETSRVMKGVQHGACDYLLKPIRMKELRNIWQHVYRKKIHEVREIEGHDISEDMLQFRNCSEDFDDRQSSGGADLSSVRKRKDLDTSDQEVNDSAAVKKARVVWSVDLHQKFVNAVNQIGFDKVGPKKILDLMNVRGLTRENVASHLQKYRLYLSRLQKQHEGKNCGANMQSDFSPKAPQANFGLQNSTPVNQANTAGGYVPVGIHPTVPITQKFQAQNRTPVHVDNEKSTVALHIKDQKEAARPDISNSRKLNSTPLGGVLSFKSTATNVEYKPVEPSTSKHQNLTGGIPISQFMQYPKHDHEPYSLLEDYSHLPLSSQLHQTQREPTFTDYKSHNNKTIMPVTCTIDSVSVQVERGIVNPQEVNRSGSWLPPIREPSMKTDTDLISLPQDMPLCSLQNISCFENVGLNSMDIFQYDDSMSLTEFQSNWYEGLEFNTDYLYEPLEYPIIDDCLFA
ncbi:uncharacterized protein A4U43_C04F5810 [Asparagus officinalis]|uniref:Two-component response regulator n=1 Tax=Asparagus officinalis TaxID=4686 RepID=A0A5P1F403_ASPOF|nr:two-component response regulator ORR26-like [Asparagus officinalis]ONK71190.1 uncharacterized protein A4U43_C04F5810 [Asparagus officinalis]